MITETTKGAKPPLGTAADEAELLRAALSVAAVGLMVLDAQGVIRAFNAAAEGLLGFDAAEVVGRPVDIFQSGPAFGLDTLLDTEEAPGDVARRVVDFRHAAGHLVAVETVVDVTQIGDDAVYVLTLHEADLLQGETWLEAEQRLSAVSANLPGVIFQRVMQADGHIYYPFFSSGVRDTLGYEPEDLRITAEGCLDCIHWADRADYVERMRSSAISLKPTTEQFRVITRSGEVKWLSGTARPERLGNGDILWDGVLIDVTDRKRAELRLEMIMDHAADGIVTVDADGRIESVNAAIERIFGYTADELIGRDIGILMPEANQSQYSSYIQRYLETGDRWMINAGARELVARTSDGKEFPIEVALSEVLTEGRRLFIGIMRDITRRKATEEQLHETEQRLGSIAANIQGIVFQRAQREDGTTAFTFVSEGCRSILGVEPQEVLDEPALFLDFMEPADRAAYLEATERSARTLEPVENDIKVTNLSGEERWLRSWARPRRLVDGTIVWDGVALDVTDRKKAEDRLMFLAYYDPLTGLGNRTLFVERFYRAVTFARRTSKRVAVMSLGLDRFSMINASMGHSTGDKVLSAVARRLQSSLVEGGLICRAGGDKFLVMLPGVAGEEGVEEAIRNIQGRFDHPIDVDGQEFDVSISVGASLFPGDGEDAETLIMHADAALHRAKAKGSNSFQLFTEEMGARAQQLLSMQHRIRRALDHGEFVAFFQPQYETWSGRLTGFEALARWMSPEHGLIPPSEFIEVAEEYGLIDGICEQVMRDACRWNRRWLAAKLPSVPVAVNISGRQFHNARHLLGLVESVLRESRLDPSLLELELTESSAMSDPENAIAVVAELAERGLSCAIDDFGTGYSSLSVLKRFPIRKLKIDRSFVSEVTTDVGDAAIVSAIVAMAKALNLKIVAEGVETMEHLQFLHSAGADQVQGYLFSKPLPGDEAERLLQERGATWSLAEQRA